MCAPGVESSVVEIVFFFAAGLKPHCSVASAKDKIYLNQ
jgi:hypothetical protein